MLNGSTIGVASTFCSVGLLLLFGFGPVWSGPLPLAFLAGPGLAGLGGLTALPFGSWFLCPAAPAGVLATFGCAVGADVAGAPPPLSLNSSCSCWAPLGPCGGMPSFGIADFAISCTSIESGFLSLKMSGESGCPSV